MFDNAIFLLQIAVIIGFSRVVAWGFGKLGQPQVVGEMAAGIALGPTLFGLFAPAAYHALFPPASLGFLNALSQAGLVIFIFIVGVRLDFAELKRQSGVAVVTSCIGVIAPLLMGILLAQYLYPRYGSGNHLVFALFVGTAMSVTAFPVLARILMERNLLHTRLGSVAIACAAVGDITAWILLAVLLALKNQDQHARPIWMMLLFLAGYIAFMIVTGLVLRAWSRRLDERNLPVGALVMFIVLALLSGAAAEWIGVHALVGAFIAGLITPRQFRPQLIEKLETAMLLLLIPLFFALTGLRTNLLFTAGASAYGDLLLVLLVAIVSKWGGSLLGARAKGMSWRDASQLGLMMNTRGLVELIVLNVGLESGILSATLFSMMVMMALVTTFMATPLMDWTTGKKKLRVVAA
jgi:Kef-type K+ transport system membrane component KefB